MSGYTIPQVVAQHPRGDRIMDVYSHLLSERIVYLGTEVDAGVANAVIAQLLHLDADSPDRDVQFSINCAGGDPSAGREAIVEVDADAPVERGAESVPRAREGVVA